jgi:AsmA protein
LRADQVDVDRYLPPSGDAADEDSERKVGDIELASEPLANFVMQGSASVGDLTIAGMRYEQFSTSLTIGGGRASLSDVSTRLYGGEFTGSFTIETAAGQPTIRLLGNGRNLALDPLLTAMLGDSHISGTGDFTLDLAGTGDTIGAAMGTAAGSMSLNLRDGILQGFNVGRDLCATMNRLNGLPAPENAPEATAYTQIRGTATVREGIAGSADMLVVTSYMRMTGAANMRLVDQRIDSNYDARMTGPVNLRGCERLNSRIDDSIPIGFSLDGKLPDVKPGFDVAQLIEDWAKRELENRARDSVRDRILDEIFN